MARSPLDRASRLARSGRYGELIALLEPQLPLFRDSSRYYRLLGSACLRTGDLGGANTYLKRAAQLDPSNLLTALAIAALCLRRGETEKAIAQYLEVLDAEPRNRLARTSLGFLRKPGVIDRLAISADGETFRRFYPREPGMPPWVLPIMLVAAVLAIGLSLLPWAIRAGKAVVDSRAPRPEIAAVQLSEDDRTNPVASAGTSRYILTEKDAVAAFEAAKRFFQTYRDNAALVEINRLLESNASESIKEKARTLRGLVAPPDWRTIRDQPSFAAVSGDPRLYDGCAVAWKGRAANVLRDGAGTGFDFLVGYHDKKRLEGILKARISDLGVLVPSESAFELLARIRSTEGGFVLEGLAVHELLE